MNDTVLNVVQQKIDRLHFALLKFQYKKENYTLNVRVKAANEGWLTCFLDKGDNPDILHKKVTLVQRSGSDYLYITGKVCDTWRENQQIIFIQISKACWFTRQTKGKNTWFQQKHIYIPMPVKNCASELEMAG